MSDNHEHEHEEEDDLLPGEVGPEDLTDQIAKKYDPERLLTMVSKKAGKGEPLDAITRSRYEGKFGVDLGHVRVITGEFAEEFNKRRNAYAVTIGATGMILMSGSPDRSMMSTHGQALLAHELTHVAQAAKGLYRSSRIASMPFADEGYRMEEEAHEHEELERQELAGIQGDPNRLTEVNGDMEKLYKEKIYKEQVQQMKEQVMGLIHDNMRNQDLRAGKDPRRP